MSTSTKKNPKTVSNAKQGVFLLIFFSVVGTTFLCREFLSAPGLPPSAPKSVDSSNSRHGFHFEEVSKQSGVDFVHASPTKLDSRLNNIMPIIASMGAGVSVVDFDRDGFPDLYTVTSVEGGRNRLYRNLGDGTFKDVAEAMGIAELNSVEQGVCMGAVWGDYDNDGYDDVLVYRGGRPDLFHNDKGKGFTRVTEKCGLPAWVNSNSAIWLDYDGDGFLDMFITGYWADDINLWKLTTTQIMPESFQYAGNGGRKYLLRNRGDGTFEDVTKTTGLDKTRWSLAVAATDLRGSGYPDLVIANDYGVNEYYENQNGKAFIEKGMSSRIGEQSKSGMSVSFGDIYNKGRFCIYVTNISEPGILLQGNNLWVPDSKRPSEEPRYTNHAGSLGVELGGWSWGAQFGDFNNDGFVDLFLTNGYISADRASNYWYDYSLIAGANKAIISDAKNWPDMKGRSLAGYQQKCLWVNRNGKFADVCQAVGIRDTYDGRAVAMVDLWNRGVLDLVLANQNGPLLIYKNSVAKENDWIQFELKGSKSNRSAIGAQIRLTWNGRTQVQEVSGGNGYASQNQRRLHFGLGKDAKIDRAEIIWPGSKRTQEILSPTKNTLHRIEEES